MYISYVPDIDLGKKAIIIKRRTISKRKDIKVSSNLQALIDIFAIYHVHMDHNAPCLPRKILHTHCFQFLLGFTVVPREIEDNGYINFGSEQGALWSM